MLKLLTSNEVSLEKRIHLGGALNRHGGCAHRWSDMGSSIKSYQWVCQH